MSRPLPIGIQDFKKIRNLNSLYVDKTDMIVRMMAERAEVYLYTRPRRFGKSLNLSMLDAFFNLEYPKDNTWFDGLKVSGCEECLVHRNAHPVIHFDFKDLDSPNHAVFLEKLKRKLSKLYGRYKYLSDSNELDEVDKMDFHSVFTRTVDEAGIGYSLKDLSDMLYKHHGTKVVILLDEYDNPIHNTYGKQHQSAITQTIREMLSSALKANDSLEFGVVTGVMQIAKESIFSGLNNPNINNIFSTSYDEMFGFTDDEVESICSEYNCLDKSAEIKDWYDGYRFGNANVYNPWSVVMYIHENFAPKPYWANTSSNSIIDALLDNADDRVFEELKSLSQGESLLKAIDVTMTFNDLNGNPDNIYSMMVMSGYLKAIPSGNYHEVSIPNGEIYMIFGNHLAKRIVRTCSDSDVLAGIKDMADSIVNNDVDKLEESLYHIFASSLSALILDHEHVYEGVMTSLLLYLSGKYRVKAERENGKGRLDILLEPRSQSMPNVIIELKHLKPDEKDEKLPSEAAEALKQIHKKDYIFGMKGRILLYGIAFKGMEAKVVSEVLVR